MATTTTSSSPDTPWLLSLPHELTNEIVAHVAAFSSFSSSCFSSSSKHPHSSTSMGTSNPSHWDAYKFHKLTPSSLRDLQNLALVHTHLLPFCRSQLFRTLRLYPAMHPDRVTALLDLFTRTPELSRDVRGVWWSVAVEEYRVPYSCSQGEHETTGESLGPHSSYELFRRKTEEREVRKAQQRLELLNILAKNGRGLKRLWVTGCEMQRKWDSAGQTRRGSSKRSWIAVEVAEEEEMLSRGAVVRTLGALLGSSPGLSLVSIANVAFPADVLKGCANLRVLRLGEDVRVIASNGFGSDDELKSSASPKVVRPLALHLSKSTLGTDTSALFEPRWVGFKAASCSIIEHSENRTTSVISTPPLDLSKVRALSCHYPSPELLALTRHLSKNDWRNDGDLKEVALQVSDLGMLVDELFTESSSLLSLFGRRRLGRLSLAIALPSSSTRASVPNTPTAAVPPFPTMNVTSPVSPLTMTDRVTKLLTFLISHRTAQNISVEFKVSIEQGPDILLNGLDLEPIARRLSSESSIIGGFSHSSRIDVHFSLSPGCYTAYSYAASPDIGGEDVGEGLSKERVERSYREAVDMLSRAGVQLDVGYDVVG